MRFEVGANRAAVQAAELVNHVREGTLTAAGFAELYDVPEATRAVDEDALARLHELATELTEVFRSEHPHLVVNALLAEVEVRPHVTDHDDRGNHLHYEAPDADVVDRVRANTLMGLAVLLCDDHERIGTCDAANCERAWVDTSRNARRRFCSGSCANRTHVAAHRARRRDAGGGA